MRYVFFRRDLSRLLDAYEDYDLVLAYEEVASHKGTSAAHIYGGIIAVMTELCETREVPFCGIPVGTIKKTASGKGNCSKEKMMAAARLRWSVEPGEDEADALWVAESLLVDLGFKEPWEGPPFEEI